MDHSQSPPNTINDMKKGPSVANHTTGLDPHEVLSGPRLMAKISVKKFRHLTVDIFLSLIFFYE